MLVFCDVDCVSGCVRETCTMRRVKYVRGIVCRSPGVLFCIRCASVDHLSLSYLTTAVAHLALVWRSLCCVLLCMDACYLSLSCLTPIHRF